MTTEQKEQLASEIANLEFQASKAAQETFMIGNLLQSNAIPQAGNIGSGVWPYPIGTSSMKGW